MKNGLKYIAVMFESITKVEKEHEERYRKLLKNLEDDTVFKKEGKVYWKCRNCGYIHEGNEAPEKCPVCAHPRAYFEILGENY
ncbi:MAG: hypothetical protein QMC80_08455 [Thermoplasmatales archaeon]|nr:hypothetical protein [Thermoplasmatales archaeon]